MKSTRTSLYLLVLNILFFAAVYGQTSPEQISFVRQGSKRIIFDKEQAIPLASLQPKNVVGMASMHLITPYTATDIDIEIKEDKLKFSSDTEAKASIWLGGFNPFATYDIQLEHIKEEGAIGFEFSEASKQNQFILTTHYQNNSLTDVFLHIKKEGKTVYDQSVFIKREKSLPAKGTLILQLLGSGFTLYHQESGLPTVIGQADFSQFLDLRKKSCLALFQSHIYTHLIKGNIAISEANISISTGVGLADIRAITYENGDPYVDQGRLWYTMSIRGKALPHHIQGVFSMNPFVFDIKLEGIILFDRGDDLLRNEIASHLFYDRKEKLWRGLTTGFSAYANIEKEKKQLLAIESSVDPRFGFSVMKATPFGMVGDIEDPHILFDEQANKWRMLTCENNEGYKAIILESDYWNKGYTKIAGPVAHNSTGTSIQKIGSQFYCFSGSSEREIFIYSYPDLNEKGTLQMDLPPWDNNSGTRVWPNVVQLPDGYPFKYVALMMDRYNYPGLKGPNWSYGALYLYHGY